MNLSPADISADSVILAIAAREIRVVAKNRVTLNAAQFDACVRDGSILVRCDDGPWPTWGRELGNGSRVECHLTADALERVAFYRKNMAKTPRVTLAQINATLRPLGLSCRKRDGEFRVNFIGGEEATAYYTSEADDALQTGQAMAARRNAAPAAPAAGDTDRGFRFFWSYLAHYTNGQPAEVAHAQSNLIGFASRP